MQMKIAPQVTQLLVVEKLLEPNRTLARLWRQIWQEREAEQRLRQRPALDANVAARTTPKRVRFNYD